MNQNTAPITFANLARVGIKGITKDFVAVWRRSWKVVLPISIAIQTLIVFYDIVGRSQADDLRMLISIGSALAAIVWSMVYVLIIPAVVKSLRTHSTLHLQSHLRKSIGPLTIESLRVLGRVMVGYICLIVPGVIRQVRFSFVSYIVQFDPKYAAGDIDALEASAEIVHGRSWSVFGAAMLVFVSTFSMSLITSVYSFSDHPVIFSLGSILSILASVAAEVAWYSIYEELSRVGSASSNLLHP